MQSKDFPADSGLHPIPGFGEIGYALSPENAAAVEAAEPTAGESLIIDGQWYSFGYYGDGDGDGIINGQDPDAAEADYVLEDVPAAAEIPDDAVVNWIQDFGTGETLFGTEKIRLVRYIDPTSGDEIAKVIDMTEGSETYGQAIHAMHATEDGSVEMYLGEAESPEISISAEQMADLEELAADRRLDDHEGELMAGVREDLAAEGIAPSAFLDEYQSNRLAYITYEMPDGSVKVRYRHQPSFFAISTAVDSSEWVKGGTLVKGDANWDLLQEAVQAEDAAEEYSHTFQNIWSGTKTGAVTGGLLGAAGGTIAGLAGGPWLAFLDAAAFGALGFVAGAALGGISGLIYGLSLIHI